MPTVVSAKPSAKLLKSKPRTGQPWQPWEFERIRADVVRYGLRATARGLQRSLPEVSAKALELSVAVSQAELLRQKQRLRERGYEPVANVLPKRGRDTAWTQEEDDILIARFAGEGADALAQVLSRRHPKAIAIRACRLGLTDPKDTAFSSSGKTWSAAELKIIDRMSCLDDAKQALALLPGRTLRSIENKYRERNKTAAPRRVVRGWTAEDDARLAELYGSLSIGDVAATMGRSYGSVANRASVLKLTSPAPVWEEWEDVYLKDVYTEIPTDEIATALKRSANACIRRATELGFAHAHTHIFSSKPAKGDWPMK